jgi:hypothetical protein
MRKTTSKYKPKDSASYAAHRKAMGLMLLDAIDGTNLYAKWRADEQKEYARRKKKIQADIDHWKARLRELRAKNKRKPSKRARK